MKIQNVEIKVKDTSATGSTIPAQQGQQYQPINIFF
jgi:hypothetical protein